MEETKFSLVELFLKWGANLNQATILNTIVIISLIIIGSWIVNWLTKNVIVAIVKQIIKKSKNKYDDIFIKRRVFDHLSHISPAFLIYYTIPLAITTEAYYSVLQSFTYIYMVIAVLLVLNQFLNALNEIFDLIAERKQLSISLKGYVQVLKITFIIIATILVVAAMLDKKPGVIFAGLGAMTAVLMLIFKDTILGFVASIQLSAYKMLKVGDWITMPSKNADGNVIDISLSTVKVQNFDKSISTIPTYTLVSESFTNWEGMVVSGGRRIKRAINIDVHSIKFCNDEMLEKFKKIHYLNDYIESKQQELEKWNKDNNIDNNVVVNGKRLTNIGIFRVYIEKYLRDNFRYFKKFEKKIFYKNDLQIERFIVHDKDKFLDDFGSEAIEYLKDIDGKTVIIDVDKFLKVHSNKILLENDKIYFIKRFRVLNLRKNTTVEVEKIEKIVEKQGLFSDDMLLLVKEEEPTETGVPIQVVVFAATTNASEFEKIQGDLFDHLIAIIPEFELKVFQRPSGSDFIIK
jgi:miniconductance mechanosensitive channel